MKPEHTIYLYLVDGKPKPSCDVLYAKRGEKVRWISGTEGVTFEISFNKNGEPLDFKTDQTDTKSHPIKKIGKYDYSVKELETGVVLDPTIDVGKPGP